MDYIKVGKISHYFDKIGVAALEISGEALKVGDKIRVGEQDDGFEQTVVSMQADHEVVEVAKIGQDVGLKVDQQVKANSNVYLVK